MEIKSLNKYSFREVIGNSNDSKTQLMKNYVHIPDRYVPPRAVAVLPELLQIRRNVVSPRRTLSSRVCFGPVQGVTRLINSLEAKDMINKSAELKKPLFLLKTEQNGYVIHIDNTDAGLLLWLLGYTIGYTIGILGYSNEYVKTHGFPSESPCLDIYEALSSQPCEWRCSECQRAMPSQASLQHHVDMEHQSGRMHPRRKHRCQRCKRMFTRLFTLKRHMARHCADREEKRADSTQCSAGESANIVAELDSNPLLEEHQIPSVEVLQNFSSNIDLNILLDTYPTVTLDLPASCRSNVEPTDSESKVGKDDVGQDNVPGSYENDCIALNSNDYKNPRTGLEFQESAVLTRSPSVACKKTKSQVKQQNTRDTSQEIFSCDCDRVYLAKDKLIRHVAEHPGAPAAVNSDILYKCEDCQLIFKRRGMFVNHLWRVHENSAGAAAAAVPVRGVPQAGPRGGHARPPRAPAASGQRRDAKS